jgi:hypothetical protein
MELNYLRHPVRTLKNIHASLIDQTISANLEQAYEYAANGNPDGFKRHCSHAERLAYQYAPDRLDEVRQLAAARPDLFNEPDNTFSLKYTSVQRRQAEASR